VGGEFGEVYYANGLIDYLYSAKYNSNSFQFFLFPLMGNVFVFLNGKLAVQ
jgi:hypothetical protein